MSSASDEESVDQEFPGDPEVLLGPVATFLEEAESVEEWEDPLFGQALVRLPKFLNTFFGVFLAEILDLKIETTGPVARETASDFLCDLEREKGPKKREETWPLLADFIDYCDLSEDIDGLSSPSEAMFHLTEILDTAEEVLSSIEHWADMVDEAALQGVALDFIGRFTEIRKKLQV